MLFSAFQLIMFYLIHFTFILHFRAIQLLRSISSTVHLRFTLNSSQWITFFARLAHRATPPSLHPPIMKQWLPLYIAVIPSHASNGRRLDQLCAVLNACQRLLKRALLIHTHRRLKAEIEQMYEDNEQRPVCILGHSMGVMCAHYFLHWAAKETGGYATFTPPSANPPTQNPYSVPTPLQLSSPPPPLTLLSTRRREWTDKHANFGGGGGGRSF